jgi:hypothetical protein
MPIAYAAAPAAVNAAAAVMHRRDERSILCNRSIGNVGNQSEMALRIACLHDPGCGFAATAADEVETRHIERLRQGGRGGEGGDPLAGDGSGRLRQPRVIDEPAAAQQKARSTGSFGSAYRDRSRGDLGIRLRTPYRAWPDCPQGANLRSQKRRTL